MGKNLFDDFSQSIFDILTKNKNKTSEESQIFEEIKPMRKPVKFALAISILITLLVGFIYFFFALPALNPQSQEFYFTIIFITLIFFVISTLLGVRFNRIAKSIVLTIIVVAIVTPSIGAFISSPLFWAKSYSKIINVEEGIFEKDISEVSIRQVPIVDKDTAEIIGSKQMGVMASLVSQFEIDNNYAQINVKGHPFRVSPLKYADLFKYIKNFRDGIPNYVEVDMNKQEARVLPLKKPIMYSNSDYLMRDLKRHLRFQYPTAIFGEINFEFDDEMNAYYITPVLYKPIMFFGGLDVKEVIITDAHTGESKKYKPEEVPSWVDRAYPADMIIDQLDQRGMYAGGFLNSKLSQSGVTHTTEGYNYVSIGEDIFLTTGVTSIKSDESNLGFYYTNLRTKETKFYPCPSSTEMAAMKSAEGKVQEKRYVATFPVVLNISNQPVYFMSLKDNAGTAKLFAIIDARQYTDVIIGESVEEVLNNYLKENPSENTNPSDFTTLEIEVKEIKEVVIDSNTYFYIKSSDGKVFNLKVKDISPSQAFIKPGDKLTILTDKDNIKEIQ